MPGNRSARTDRQGRRPLAVAAALALTLAGGAVETAADELWYNQPRVSVGALYNDNIGLSASDPISSFGAQAQAGIRGGWRTETTDVGVTGTLAGTTYFDASGYDSTSAGLALDAAHQRERNRFGLGATFSYLPTTASEVDTTGDQQQDSTQLRWSLAPSWSHQLTERATVEVAANYTEASYQGSGSDLSDYQNLGGWLLGGYDLSEVTRGTARLSFDRYEKGGTSGQSDSIGLSGGLSHRFSETLSGLVELGARYSESEQTGVPGETISSSSVGPLVNLQVDWRRETGQVSAQLGRWLTPSGNGLLDSTRASVSASERLSERWSVQGGVQAYRNRGDEEGLGVSTQRNRDYVAANLGFSYRLTEWWQLQGAYRFAWQQYDGDEEGDGAAIGNSVFLNVSYTWPRELPGLYSGPR